MHSPRHWTEVRGRLHAPAALLPGKASPLPIGQKEVSLGSTTCMGALETRQSSWPYRKLDPYFPAVQQLEWSTYRLSLVMA